MLNFSLEECGFIAGKLGAAPNLKRPFLIGVRKMPIIHAPKYDDTFILLTNCDPYEAPIVFPGATHAYQLNSKLSTDINKDGVGDVASIKPGKYLLNDAITSPYPILILTTLDGSGNIPAWRDVNHDGKFSETELTVDTIATAILLHGGYDMPADSAHSSSIGCQTTSLKYLKLVSAACKKMKSKIIDYVLITEDEANKIIAEFKV